MPRSVSSSSEDEVESSAPKSRVQSEESGKKTTRYQCPADFVPLCHQPCSSTVKESMKKNKNELWLIKTPTSFNPEWFSSIEVPLSGLQTLKVRAADGADSGSGQQFYSVRASTHGTSELYLLTSEKSSDGMVFGPTFSGLLNVCESYGNCGANLAPQVIPASPAPSIPLGLKQRFHPFGNKAPTLNCEAESETDGAALGLLSTSLRPLGVKRFIEETRQEDGVEDKGRKKKKKKKEKRIKTEQEDEKVILAVKEEPDTEIHNEVMTELPADEGLVLEERRKKKKKKKDRERDDLEPSVMVKVEEVTVKCEPIDSLCSDVVEGCGKKKKKKKKSKIADD